MSLKILITGSQGMLGKSLTKKMEYKYYSPSKSQLNLKNYKKIKKYIELNKINFVINCAAKVGGIQDNINNQIEYLIENIEINKNIIMAAYHSGVKKFINIGSSCIYPKDSKGKLKEENIFKGNLEPTNEGYALSKIFAVKLCEFISSKKKFFYKSLIPCNLYGPNDKYDVKKSHLVPSIIHKLNKAKMEKKKYVDIWGNGKSKREFMYIEDMAEAIIFSINNLKKLPSTLNVGTGMDYTVKEYYDIASKIIYPEVKFYHNLSKPSGMKRKVLNVNKINKLGWKSKYKLKLGIKKTFLEYLKNEN